MSNQDQLKMHSPNLVDSNIEKIAALFPNCITETKDENGELKKAVDFDLLKQELSQVLVEGEQERYRLDWVGKKEAILTANAPIVKTLRPCREESVNFDKTENLFIEGDNLEALKLLQENYLGKVKMIYIDPPYNTGNDFIYEDDFAESTGDFFERSNQIDEEGNTLVAWKESEGRFHSGWLTMMFSRLKLTRNLLSDDGIIFISIDDNEVFNLRHILDEVYGKSNFLGIFQWRRRQTTDNRNMSRVSVDHEYIIAYGKSDLSILTGKKIDETKYKNPDNDVRGPWASIDLSGLATASQRPNLHFDIIDPKTGNIYKPNPNRGWSKSKDNIGKMIEEGRILFPAKPDGRPREKKFLANLQSNVTGFSTCLNSDVVGFNTNATREVTELFGGKFFDFPKPVSLLKELIAQATEKDSLVLDFFAGSSSTAHAVMQLNAEDDGNRKFIMVQVPEHIDQKADAYTAGYETVSRISKERIRRAGKKILDENKDKESILDLDIGFRVLKIDSTNMKDVYYTPDTLKQADMLDLASNIKEDRTSEDLLFQVMLDWGLELSLPIERKTIAGKEVFYVAGNSLVACFDDLTFDVVDEVAKDHPLRFVSAEKAIHLDHDKTNIKERFKQLSPDTEVKFL